MDAVLRVAMGVLSVACIVVAFSRLPIRYREEYQRYYRKFPPGLRPDDDWPPLPLLRALWFMGGVMGIIVTVVWTGR